MSIIEDAIIFNLRDAESDYSVFTFVARDQPLSADYSL